MLVCPDWEEDPVVSLLLPRATRHTSSMAVFNYAWALVLNFASVFLFPFCSRLVFFLFQPRQHLPPAPARLASRSIFCTVGAARILVATFQFCAQVSSTTRFCPLFLQLRSCRLPSLDIVSHPMIAASPPLVSLVLPGCLTAVFFSSWHVYLRELDTFQDQLSRMDC